MVFLEFGQLPEKLPIACSRVPLAIGSPMLPIPQTLECATHTCSTCHVESMTGTSSCTDTPPRKKNNVVSATLQSMQYQRDESFLFSACPSWNCNGSTKIAFQRGTICGTTKAPSRSSHRTKPGGKLGLHSPSLSPKKFSCLAEFGIMTSANNPESQDPGRSRK